MVSRATCSSLGGAAVAWRRDGRVWVDRWVEDFTDELIGLMAGEEVFPVVESL
jgi:hypothetical protein